MTEPRGAPQWLRLVLALLCWVLSSTLVLAAFGAPGPSASLAAGAVSAGVLLLLARACPPAVPFAPLHAAAVLRSWVLFAPTWIAVLLCYLWLMRALGRPVAPQEAMTALTGESMSARVAMAFAAVVVAPVLEEILFRGYLLSTLGQWFGSRSFGPAVAMVVTAAAFGVVHGLDYAIPLACVGLWLGRLRVVHGSLWAPMLGHALHNGLMVGVTLLWPGSVLLLYPQ